MKGITLLHMTANCKATTTKTAGYWQSSINLTEYRAQNHSHNYMEINIMIEVALQIRREWMDFLKKLLGE